MVFFNTKKKLVSTGFEPTTSPSPAKRLIHLSYEDVTKDSSVIVISDDDEEMKNASNDLPNIVSATKTPKFQ